MATYKEHVGLGIDPNTNDLHLDATGNLVVVTGAKAVGQHVRQRLKTFEGEWFLDQSAGVPWLSEIMGQQYNPALAEAVVKASILDTQGVTEITSFSVGFIRDQRNLRIRDIEVDTIYEQGVRI